MQPKDGYRVMGTHKVPPLSCSFHLPLGDQIAGVAFSVGCHHVYCLSDLERATETLWLSVSPSLKEAE